MAFLGMIDEVAVLQCDACAWPIWSYRDMVVVDDRDLPESTRDLFRDACERLGIDSQDQIRARNPRGHRRGVSRAVRVGFDQRGRGWAQNRAAFKETFGNSKRLKQILADRMSRSGDRAYIKHADLGCGTGGLLERSIMSHSYGHFVGVDLSPVMIDGAHARLASLLNTATTTLDLVVSSAERTPLRCEWFDLVTAELVLHHLKDPAAVVAEVARIVRPGGAVVVQVPGPGYTLDVNFGKGWVSCPIGPKTLPGHRDPLGRFAPDEIQALARSAGLEPEHLDVDSWRYRFESVDSCLAFLGRTGADARIRGYATPLDVLAAYRHFFGTGPLEIRGEFITLTAKKPETGAETALPELVVSPSREKRGDG